MDSIVSMSARKGAIQAHVVQPVQYARLAFDMPNFASFEPWALALFICAAIAVFRFNVGAAMTLVGSSAVGMILLVSGLTGWPR